MRSVPRRVVCSSPAPLEAGDGHSGAPAEQESAPQNGTWCRFPGAAIRGISRTVVDQSADARRQMESCTVMPRASYASYISNNRSRGMTVCDPNCALKRLTASPCRTFQAGVACFSSKYHTFAFPAPLSSTALATFLRMSYLRSFPGIVCTSK